MYTKTQILQSKKYRQYKDILAVILSNNKNYTHEEIKQELDKFFIYSNKGRKKLGGINYGFRWRHLAYTK